MTRFTKHLVLLTSALLSACGGGGRALPSPATPEVARTSTAAVQIEVPLHVTAASAHTRSPQWVSPNTSFFLVDLQNNHDPRFDNTFTVDATHCQQSTDQGVPVLNCSFTATIPGGDPTTQVWSVAAGAGMPDGSSGPPLSVRHDVTPVVLNTGQTQIVAFLDTVVARVGVSVLSLGNFQGPLPVKYVPYFTVTAFDAFGNASPGDETLNLGVEQFADPFTLSASDPSGQLGLGTIFASGGPSPYNPPNPPPVTSMTFDRLNRVIAIEIVDGATSSATVNVSYDLPAVDLEPSEFPQLHGAWGMPATSAKLATYTCGPLTNSPTANPCTQTFP